MKPVILIILAAACAFGQEAPKLPQNPPDTQRVFDLKYVDANEAKVLIGTFPVSSNAVPALHLISVRGSKETLDAIGEVLKRVDVPPPARKNIEFTTYVLLASANAADGPEPSDLAPVIKQLHAVFPDKNYKLLETVFLRARDGQGAQTSGTFTAPRAGAYNLSLGTATLSADKLVRLDRLSFEVRGQQRGLVTSIDIHEGQKVVVGKLAGEEALVLVISAKVVE